MEAILFGIREWFNVRHSKLNALIYRVQQIIGGVYEKYFTMYAALLFAFFAGACMGMTGDNCYGKIPFNSPVFWCLSLIIIFFMFQTFLLIPLTFWRFVRILTVAICGHYLAYQAYGFWSLFNVDQVINDLSSMPAGEIRSIIMNKSDIIVAGDNVCKPYAYANITYGQIWIVAPALILVAICFFTGNSRTDE